MFLYLYLKRLRNLLKVKIFFYYVVFPVIFSSGVLFNCANQQPPGGGEEDKTPPEIVSQYPEPNSLNFRDNRLRFEFNEYVDRRSFQDAFRISPPVIGDVNFNWSGKEVEVIFERSLDKVNSNKTFVVSINSNLKDIHGNGLSQPMMFAFSTGPQIDKAAISGKVINIDKNVISIFAYDITSSEESYNPVKKVADYITETSTDGNYNLVNMAPGLYRVIAVKDDDKNLLYSEGIEDYGVLSRDVTLTDTIKVTNMNFLMFIKNAADSSLIEWNSFAKDTLNIVYSSVSNNSTNVPLDQGISFFFNRFKPDRANFGNSFRLTDASNNQEKVVFSWKHDSLVQIYPVNNFKPGTTYRVSFNLRMNGDTLYDYSLKFRTISANSYGNIKGAVRKNLALRNELLTSPVQIKLESPRNITPVLRYTFDVNDTAFSLTNIVESDYNIFSYIDVNKNGNFDFGSVSPFNYSEPFYIYPGVVGVRGGWAIENVIINF
ncbi:MAG: hypothetical protein EHM58_13625 [Ignavibacteriae bacterium]|nr:MAG: hypothetical protein EHM58_13625 [Ignavibacteriota bacterium]